MSVEEIKKELRSLSPIEQAEVTAFLFHLRHGSDSEYQKSIQRRASDTDPAHWLSPEEFEKRLDEK